MGPAGCRAGSRPIAPGTPVQLPRMELEDDRTMWCVFSFLPNGEEDDDCWCTPQRQCMRTRVQDVGGLYCSGCPIGGLSGRGHAFQRVHPAGKPACGQDCLMPRTFSFRRQLKHCKGVLFRLCRWPKRPFANWRGFGTHHAARNRAAAPRQLPDNEPDSG